MTDVTELRCWPSCVDALDWSQDGILALASDERIELLFPNTVTFDRDVETAQWQHVPLQAPFFTAEELPIKEPAPLSNFSVGEEISSSAPIGISWSPPGLAKHRRCALAVLTANLVLSIWSTDDRPKEATNWDRRLIVNNALTQYFINNAVDEKSHVTDSFGEQMRLRARIRSFAWAPNLPHSSPFGFLGSRLSYGQHILAVCNDDNQIALVVVKSPTSTHGAHKSWNAEVLTHVTLSPGSESIFSKPTIFEEIMKQQRHVSHISWSPWIFKGDWCHSIIAYATNDDVRARVVTYARDSVSLGDEVVYSGIEMRFNGPLKWSSTVLDGAIALALFTVSGLIHLKISMTDASIVEQITHDIDGRWDPISGAVWDVSQCLSPRLHFSSLLSTIHNATAAVEVSPNKLEALSTPFWRDKIENSAVLFSAKNDLKGNTKMKVWGLASSPLGDFIATCHTVHPSDMIEYGSPNDRRGTIVVSALRPYSQIREGLPKSDVSAEGILFTLKKMVENTLEDSDQLPAFVEEMVTKLVHVYAAINAVADTCDTSQPDYESDELDLLVKNMKQIALFNAESLKDRFTVLTSHACNDKSPNTLERTLIGYRLAKSFCALPDALSHTPFSTAIRVQHRQAISLIRTIIEPDDAQTGEPASVDHAVSLEVAATTTDTCGFCSAPIPFTDLASASCANGHRFPRCGLSFLAIQAPGITKYCGICSTPYLSEEFVAAQEIGVGTGETQVSRNGTNTEQLSNDETHTHGNEPTRTSGAGDTDMGGMETGTLPQPANGTNDRQGIGIDADAPAAENHGGRSPITLARLLFFACDVCIFCGGKFIG